ncbi:MAG: DUF819 family protein [Phycisphaerales bacterium]|nr:DUF819 family protein [Phycisphaerales bacterium]
MQNATPTPPIPDQAATAMEAARAVVDGAAEVSEAVMPLVNEPTAVLGILLVILAIVFRTSSSSAPGLRKFYSIIPALLLCYFIPGMLGTLKLVGDPSGDLYYVASRFLLPACLVLLTIAIDLPGIIRLGPKLLVIFLAATVGVIIGGPIAVLVVGSFSPETIGGEGPNETWRGLATVAGSWIGGGANQTAMKEIFLPGEQLFSAMIAVDVIVANIWMAALLFMAGNSKAIDRKMGADRAALDTLLERVEQLNTGKRRIPSSTDLMMIAAVGFAVVGFSRLLGDGLADFFATQTTWGDKFSLSSSFFWLIVLSTTIGVSLSFLPKARSLEQVGASQVATVFLYLLVAVIGLKMDLFAIFRNPGFFLVGLIWIGIQAVLVLGTTWLLKAPIFFAAVGSQANIGGAASAPVVAAAFNPRLAPVGVLLAVLGYALGTYGAWLAAQLMRVCSTG